LFDRYQVDLVLCGHDHDYERSFPVRGADTDAGREVATGAAVNTLRPRPVTTADSGVFRHLGTATVPPFILGCGGTDAPLDEYGADNADGQRQAKVFTTGRPVPSPRPRRGLHPGRGDAVEDAVWSARRDTATGYGIAVLDVDPGSGSDGQPSIKVTQLPRGGRGPGQPGHRRQGGTDPRLHEVRDLHPGPPALSPRHVSAPQRNRLTPLDRHVTILPSSGMS